MSQSAAGALCVGDAMFVHLFILTAHQHKNTVMTPQPHATLQGAVCCRNQCHDHATLQGVRIPSALLKHRYFAIFYLFIFFKCSLGFDEWRLSYRLRYTGFEHFGHPILFFVFQCQNKSI